MARSADEIQAEIEKARESLAVTVDQLADRTSPKRIANDTKATIVAKAQTPPGMAVIAGASVLLTLYVVRNLRKVKRNRAK